MGVAERRERERQVVRKEILDAARALFIEEGYEKTSMRRIAEKIEYSPTTIYLYFHDKKELLESICEETFGKFVKILEGINKEHKDPLKNLRAGLKAYIEFGLKNPNDYMLTFMDKQDVPGSHYMRPEHSGTKAFMYLVGVVGDCVRQKKLRSADVKVTAQVLWSSIHGMTSLMIAKPNFPWAAKSKLIDGMVDLLIDGLKE
jgi:AcrR family transcriptional regulator